MPSLTLNASHINPYSKIEACVYISDLKDGSPVDHKGDPIGTNSEEHIEYLRTQVLPVLKISRYQITGVDLQDQGNQFPCFSIYRCDRGVLNQQDLKNINKKIEAALVSINKKLAATLNSMENKSGLFSSSKSKKADKYSVKKSIQNYA